VLHRCTNASGYSMYLSAPTAGVSARCDSISQRSSLISESRTMHDRIERRSMRGRIESS